MRQMLRGAALALLVVVGPGCKDPPMTNPMGDMKAVDMPKTVIIDGFGSPPDLNVQLPDLMPLPPDLVMPDLTPPPPDLFMPDLAPPALAMLPNCAVEAVNSAAIFTIVSNRCGMAGCHLNGGMGGMMALGDTAATMRTAFLQDANQAPPNLLSPNMKRIRPNDPNNSYVLYKLMNLQGNVRAMSGSGMPQGAVVFPQSEAEFCKFLNWVKSGAP